MLRVTPLFGSSPFEVDHSVLIEFGPFKLLWNVGQVDLSKYAALYDQLDAILLSNSSLPSIGALPVLIRYYHQERSNHHSTVLPPVYATFPTVKMGQMTLYTEHAVQSFDGNDTIYTLEELENAIDCIQSMKYSQSIPIQNKNSSSNKYSDAITVTAHRAGHVVGGAFFVLQQLQDETSVVLLHPYNVAREQHLDATTLLQSSSPDVLITYPGGPPFRDLQPTTATTTTLSQKQKAMFEYIMSVLRRDGNILLPVDAAGRVLEILYLLQNYWSTQRLKNSYNLCWLAPMNHPTLFFAQSQMEWMRNSLLDNSNHSNSPFALPDVHLCNRVEDLPDNQNPTCVIASGGLSMESGPSRDLLLKWADNADNAILFTDSSGCVLRNVNTKQQPQQHSSTTLAADTDASLVGEAVMEVSEWTTAAQLLKAYADATNEGREMDDSIVVDVNVPYRTPLVGAELVTFLAQEEEKRQLEKEKQQEEEMKQQVEIAKEELRLDEQETTKRKIIATKYMNPRKKNRFDSSLFFKYSKPQFLMFDAHDDLQIVGQPKGIKEGTAGKAEFIEDDYGASVVPELFVDIVSGIDPSKIAGGTGRIGENVRMGYAADKAGKPTSGPNRIAEDDDEIDDDDELALETIDLSEGKGIIRGRKGRDPMKVRTALRRIEVLAEINYIALDGRVDARSARQSVQALGPRNVVVLGGPSTETPPGTHDEVSALVDAAKGMVMHKGLVLAPSNGETVELDVGHDAFDVRIIDLPYQTSEEKESNDEPPEPIDIQENKLGLCSVAMVDCIATGQKVAADGSIVIAPKREVADEIPSVLVSDGEILLTDLRSELIAEGLKVDFRARQLIVNGKILVEKDQNTGKIGIEGPLCEDFYTVRSVVYGQFVAL